MGNVAFRGIQADRLHRLVKPIAILGLINGVGIGTNQLHAKFCKDTFTVQIQGTVQRSLATHGWEQSTRALFFDHFRHGLPADWLDVGGIRHGGICHDGGRVRVHQNDPIPLFF